MTRLTLLASVTLVLAAPSPPAWRVIGPGGGGSLFHPTVSPHDPRTAVVACDMTGSYITHDGGDTWRMFNLGDPVEFFVFDPIDSRVIYAKANGLFRTSDSGATWTRFFPRDVQRITMGDDHAAGFLHPAAGNVTALAVDPEDNHFLYLALESTLWTSYDAGATWQKSGDLPGRANHIWIDRNSFKGDRTLYVAGPAAMYVRQDARWHTNPFPGPATDIAGSAPTFYAIVAGKIYVTADGAGKWRESSLPGFQGQAATLGVSRQHPEVAYVAYSGLRAPLHATSGVAKTTDAGLHWEPVYQNVRDAWLAGRFGAGWAGIPYGIGVSPTNPEIAYATDSGRAVRTTDGGKTWNPAYSNAAPDGNWTTNGIDVTTCYGVHFDPFDPRHMFISYTDIGLWASDNGGASWYSATRNGVPNGWVNTTYWIAFDPKVRGRIWAAMSGTHDLPRPKMWRRSGVAKYRGGVCISNDGGKTWTKSNDGMEQTAATFILLDPSSPVDSRTLYVTGFGRGVYKSTNGGKTWALKNNGITQKEPFAWRISRDNKGALYLLIARRSEDGSINTDKDGAIYRSTDGAEHWTRVAMPEGANAPNGLAIDPKDPNLLYLATWARATGEHGEGGGIYLSEDAGKSWKQVLDRDRHVYDITIDPRDAEILYAAGFESSAWISHDAGEHWTRIPGFNFKWGHRVTPDPDNPKAIYITTFGGGVWHGSVDGKDLPVDIATPELQPGK